MYERRGNLRSRAAAKYEKVQFVNSDELPPSIESPRMTRASDISTYDEDFFAWTQEQAAALRRLPHELLGETVDVENVAEEIEDLGKRDLREVNSFLARLLEHLLKIVSATKAESVSHWRGEALNFQISALDAFTPSMRQFLEIDEIWKRAGKLVRASKIEGDISPACPFSIDDLLTPDFELDAALATLTARQRLARS